MNGRWNVCTSDKSTVDARDGLCAICGAKVVPVVPCDDDAIDRMAERLARQNGGRLPWVEVREIDRGAWRERARDLLCAAGDTP